MTPNYSITPCAETEDGDTFQVAPNEAAIWRLYRREADGCDVAIADLVSREGAEAVVRELEGLKAVRSSTDEEWMPIDTRPTNEEFGALLVLLPKNDMADYVVLQVSVFEGNLYADHLDGLIDWGDRITTATHCLPNLPSTDNLNLSAKE